MSFVYTKDVNSVQEFMSLSIDYKLRVGKYRVIADINMASKRVEITKIGHRRDIYKN